MDRRAGVIGLTATTKIVRVAPTCTDPLRIVRPVVALLVSSFGDLALVSDSGDHLADHPTSLPTRGAVVLRPGRD